MKTWFKTENCGFGSLSIIKREIGVARSRETLPAAEIIKTLSRLNYSFKNPYSYIFGFMTSASILRFDLKSPNN